MNLESKLTGFYSRLRRSVQILKLTRRSYRANQISDTEKGTYFIRGKRIILHGPNHLPLALELVSEDCYGLRHFKSSVKTIIDLGANIGVFAVAARQTWPHARIVAVEPGKMANLSLAQNLAGMGVVIMSCAVGPHNGTVSLSIPQDLTAATIRELPGEVSCEQCDMITFDRLCNQFDEGVDLLKLDCEGGEYHVLRSKCLDKVQYIRGELHTCADGNPKAGIEQLIARGFDIIRWQAFPDGLAGIVWADRKCSK